MNKKYNDAQIIELHAQGLTDREIAEIIGATPNNLATKRRMLYLKHESNEILREILSRNNQCVTMSYKYDSHRKTPLNREVPAKDNPVLNPQETEEKAKRLEVMPNE